MSGNELTQQKKDEAFAHECAVSIAHGFEVSGLGAFAYTVILKQLKKRRGLI